jgi:hypothetical protein
MDSLSSLNGFGMLTTMEEMAFDNVAEEGTVHHEAEEEEEDCSAEDGDDAIHSVAESTVCQALFIQDEDCSTLVVSVFNTSSRFVSCGCGGCFSCF